jgi:8-oxo-dGTP diphosphatase
MLRRLLGPIWRQLPRSFRRVGVVLSESQFTVTAGAVLLDDNGRVLMLRHRFRPGSGWGIPGGFLRPGEQPEAALRRELREEIGREPSELALAFVRTLTHVRQVETVFLGRMDGDVTSASDEIAEAAWFAPDNLPSGVTRDQRDLILRALKG